MVNRLILVFISIFFLLYCYLINDYIFSTSVGLSFALYIFLSFINKLGHELPVKEFILLLASFQWIVGAKISYNLGKQHYKYFMYVKEDEYMAYVVPAVLLFYIGFSLFPKRLEIKNLEQILITNKSKLKKTAFALVTIGLSSVVISRFYQGGLSFILFLSEILLYVGLSYLLFIYKKHKYLIIIFTLGIIFFLAVNKGSFHKLLLVGSFLIFFTITPKFKFFHKLFLILLGVSSIYIIQTVKNDLRDIIWRSNSGQNPVSVFFDLVKKEFLVDQSELYLTEEEGSVKDQAEMNVRLNQGWIISKTLENVPKNTPFQNGKTIMESIEASILPRILFPDKIGATHGLENFRKITGLPLNNNTSMELSIVAEFYANYGHIGGQIAMLLYGIFVALLIRFISNQLGHGSILIYLWFTLFFFQPVKAEIDLIKIVNHFVKSIVFFLLIKYILKNIMGYTLFVKEKDD